MAEAIKHVPAAQGKVFTVIGGDVITCKAVADETGGTYSLFETVVPPQGGPPPHVHHREDEAFYVLEGELDFQVGDKQIKAPKGSFVMAPRNIPHRLKNPGNAPAKMLVLVTPGGIERFFIEFSQLPVDQPPDFVKMAAIAQKYGLEFVA